MDNITKLKTLLNKIGKSAGLSRQYFGNNLPEGRGLYFVTNEPGDLLYIGIAQNLNKRWKQHHKYKECLKHQAKYIYFFPTGLANISFAEAWLISELQTRLNIVGVLKSKNKGKATKQKPKYKQRKVKSKIKPSRKYKSGKVKVSQYASSISTTNTANHLANKTNLERKKLKQTMKTIR